MDDNIVVHPPHVTALQKLIGKRVLRSPTTVLINNMGINSSSISVQEQQSLRRPSNEKEEDFGSVSAKKNRNGGKQEEFK